MTNRGRKLEAPHRRLETGARPLRGPGSRLVELLAVRAYRATSWLIGKIPAGVARVLIGRSAQLSYLLWPTKRHWSSSNFSHVLGLPPGSLRVHRLALAAYHEYARYIVEVMRLPFMAREDAARLVDQAALDEVPVILASSKGGLILALGHVGNNEAVAAAVAQRGWPISVVADDSAYPELFEDFRRLRESWGIHVIPWRNLREIFGVLRRREMLGLLVDWGYRDDGIPVRLFDAWTTLPAGPATLAAKTGSLILPITIRRHSRDRFHVSWGTPIEVASSAPADLQRATQRLADALAASISAAPHQWYSFKPIWPPTAEESLALKRRAEAMLANQAPDGRREDGVVASALGGATGAAIGGDDPADGTGVDPAGPARPALAESS